jgi:hypothetical protein
MGMIYGTDRARQTILTHPNNEHLLHVLDQTKSQIFAGGKFGGRPENQEMSPEAEQAQSWSQAEFDENSLLTDDEVNEKSQKRTSRVWLADCSYVYSPSTTITG